MPDKKKAAKKAAKKSESKGPGVMATLAAIFSKAAVGTDEEVIAEVNRVVGKKLKHSTLRLYKAKWRAGGFSGQKGKGKLNQPSEPVQEKKDKGKKKPMTATIALGQAKEAGDKVRDEAKEAGMEVVDVKKAGREAEDKILDQLGFVRNARGQVKPKA